MHGQYPPREGASDIPAEGEAETGLKNQPQAEGVFKASKSTCLILHVEKLRLRAGDGMIQEREGVVATLTVGHGKMARKLCLKVNRIETKEEAPLHACQRTRASVFTTATQKRIFLITCHNARISARLKSILSNQSLCNYICPHKVTDYSLGLCGGRVRTEHWESWLKVRRESTVTWEQEKSASFSHEFALPVSWNTLPYLCW